MAYYAMSDPVYREVTDSSGPASGPTPLGFYSSNWDLVPMAYAGIGALAALGKEYTIHTSVPLLSSFTADIPIEELASDAMVTIREEAKSALPYVVGGAVVIVGVTVAVVGAFLIGRRT